MFYGPSVVMTATLARHQHASAHRLVAELPADTHVHPTHGFGSFCAATQAQGLSSTLANEARVNPALTQAEEDYVTALLAGLDAYPPATRTRDRPTPPARPPIDLSPPHVADPAELRRRIGAGEWVIGFGLAVAALTNTCLMGNLLSRVPFNRAASRDVDTVAAGVFQHRHHRAATTSTEVPPPGTPAAIG